MALSRSRRDSGMNYWPGFVDALSTLILCVIFLLTVFMVAQFFLSQEVAGKDTALARLNAQISRLSQLLSLEQTGKTNLEDQVAQLRASLTAAEGERDRLRGATSASPNPAPGPGEGDNAKIDLEKEATARAVAQIENLNEQIKALRSQIAALQDALGTSEAKQKDSQLRIADLGQRLNLALAQRVQELSRYRSDFFGKLRDILGNRPDIRVVGDRFVFQSEVFFELRASGAAARRTRRARSARRRAARPGKTEFRPRSTGCCASTATPTRGSSARPRRSSRTGNCRRRAPSRWCNIWSAKACRRSAWSPPASASSNRLIRAQPTKPSATTAASS